MFQCLMFITFLVGAVVVAKFGKRVVCAAIKEMKHN